jgi:hypothetical protein
VTEERRGGVPYLTFTVSGGTALTAGEVAVLSNLSCLYALFELDEADRLRPLELARLDRWDDDLITIQRYGGKTNEQLTKLLVNLALVVGHGGEALRGPTRVVAPAGTGDELSGPTGVVAPAGSGEALRGQTGVAAPAGSGDALSGPTGVVAPAGSGEALRGQTGVVAPAGSGSQSGAGGPSGAEHPARLRVLDPLCGRGTTLNQVVMYGLDGVGMDVDPHAVDAYVTFFTTWLKNKRAVHRVERQRVRRSGRVVGHRVVIEFAATRAEQQAGAVQQVVVIADDTARSGDHLGAGSVDAIVADLPYGVQHGSRAGSELARRPADLLSGALPVWRSLLRPGGAMALAWNRKTLAAPTLLRAIDDAGLKVVDRGDSFVHQVDRSITRDIVVARRSP